MLAEILSKMIHTYVYVYMYTYVDGFFTRISFPSLVILFPIKLPHSEVPPPPLPSIPTPKHMQSMSSVVSTHSPSESVINKKKLCLGSHLPRFFTDINFFIKGGWT